MADRQMITEPATYFAKGCGRCDRFDSAACSARIWAKGLADLRRMCLEAGLSETAKWGHPCYMAGGRNVVIFGAFRNNFRLSFFNAALMADPEGVLEPQGPNSRQPGVIRFTDNAGPAAQEAVIRAYLAEAKAYAEAGKVAPKSTTQVDMPDELIAALDDDPVLAEAFAALTPGRRKSYAIAVGNAKQSATRIRRIAGYRDKILAGKGALDR